MANKLLDCIPASAMYAKTLYGFHEDFHEFVSGDLFTDTSTDAGAAVATTDAVGGVVTLTTGATNNNECALLTTKEIFKFAASKPLFFEARVQYAEANTDDANIYAGFMDAVSADCMVDDGAGPKSSFSGAGFYKVDGGTRWQLITSVGTDRTTLDLTAANSLTKSVQTAGGSSYQTLRVEIIPINSTQAEASFFIDGAHVAKLTFTYTSATEMQACCIAKAGGSNSEVLSVDYIQAFQQR